MTRFINSLFLYLCAVVESQLYNFNLNFAFVLSDGYIRECPKFHVWVLGIAPHFCASYRKECYGVTSVEARYAEGQQILCHPNFQPNLSDNLEIKQNFSVDPTQSMTLTYQQGSQYPFSYRKDIQIPNCYIVYSYRDSKGYQRNICMFRSGIPRFDRTDLYYSSGYKFGVLDVPVNRTVYQTCNPGSPCLTCSTANQSTCDSCWSQNSYGPDCSQYCPVEGGICNEANPYPKECKRGYRKVDKGNGQIECQLCNQLNCENCDSIGLCIKCLTYVYIYIGGPSDTRPSYNSPTLLNKQKQCTPINNCIEYLDDETQDIKCLTCMLGFYFENNQCNSCDNYGNPSDIGPCFVCSDSKNCLICKIGFVYKNGKCVELNPFNCTEPCLTCLLTDLTACTTCMSGYYAEGNKCYCDERFDRYDVDGKCLKCIDGVCETCISFYDCISCKPSTLRVLDGTKCVCQDGYYDSGSKNYICEKCHPMCQTCYGGDALSCWTCNDFQNRKYVQGLCICSQGFGEDQNDQDEFTCKQCHPRCNTCEYANDSTSCTSCLEEQNRQLAITTECVCIDNYGDNYGEYDICYICHYSCQQCDGPTEFDCTSCSDISHRQLAQNFQCKCTKGYLENPSELSDCLSCHYSCTDCNNDPNKDQCTECPASRVPEADGSVFKCICNDPNYFDDGINKECQLCHYSCLSCSFYGPSFCKSCDLSIRKLRSQHCICNDKTFDDDISTCLPCHPSCLTCQGTESTDCLTCSSDIELRELLGGACVCQDGYFEDNNASICSQCSLKCKTCAITKDLCLTCPPNSFRELGDDQSCSCPLGFFDDPDTLSCLICHLKCLTCFGIEENQCLTCKPLSNRFLKNNQCLCKSHYYEVNVEQCSICSIDCLDCAEEFDHCTSCITGKKLHENKCQCGTKLEGLLISTFKMFGEIECQKCHYSCLSCYGPSKEKCINCYEIENRYQNGSKCLCSNGYYDSGVPVCQKCGYQCQTCIDTQNQCLSCQQNSLRTLNAQIFSCACNPGYFDDGTNPVCQKCDYKCAQCSIRFDHCITCDDDSNRQFKDAFFSCDCISGFYDGGDAICKPCHYSCNECTGSGSSNCSTCNMINPLAKRALFYTQCICQVGFYDDGFSANCQPCDTTCIECKNQAYSCITCSTTRLLKQNQCKCKSGYFETGQKDCLICDKNCLECKNTSKTCIDCNSALFRTLDSANKTCVCQIGYLEINSECVKCNSSCLTCSISQDNCTSCIQDRLFTNNSCLCQEGFFESQGVCYSCHKSCLTCQNTELFCLTCSIQNYRKLTINNTCVCFEGYYEQKVTLSCEKCDFSCKTCDTNASNCTSCHTSLNFDIYFNKCICEQGYYLDQTTYSCLECHVSCLTCDLYSRCTSCRAQTRRFNDELDTCDCKEGYFETNQPDCQQCNLNCLSCSVSKNNCESCDPVFLRKLVGNQCICPSGYYDAGIQLCQSCGGKCKTCVDKWNKCTLCYQTEQNRFLNVNTCECLSGYFDSGQDICQKCSIKCKTCVGANDYCTSCDIDQKRLDYSSIHKCPCIQGFYEDETGECQKCHIKCDGCVNTRENCLNCNNPLKSNRYLLSNQCNCKPGFYDDTIQEECQKCSKACETCITTAENCLQCQGNLRHNPPECKCLDGYYEDKSLNCLQCQNQCQTCSQTENNCLICKNGRINQNCECPKGYFEAGQINCIKCEFQCSECFQFSTQCTVCRGNRINPHICICEDGYYDDGVNDDCKQCNFRCKTCDISGCLTCNGNRVLSNEQTCDPPVNSVSYETTPWCSNCEVAVLMIRFSDDLNSIQIKFDFSLKPIQQTNQCGQIFEEETLGLLGIGYNCDLDKNDNSILIVSLGQESKILVGDSFKLKGSTLLHVDCSQKLQTFIFNNVQAPLNILEPIINFNVPNYQISSCVENIISLNQTDHDGKRRFSQIKWSYKILNQDFKQELEDLIDKFNTYQEIDIVIPSQTLPENSLITFFLQITNFLDSSSSISFKLNTLSSFQPIIATEVKNSYFNYQTIVINYSIKLKNCNNQAQVSNPKYDINLIEINRSNKQAISSNINLSFQSQESEFSASIPKFQLTPNTIYYFKLNATELYTEQSAEIYFNFGIKQAELVCQFVNSASVQDYRKDLNLYIQCKDSNIDYDWNLDPQLNIEVSCKDLTTQDVCLNQKKQKLVINQSSFEQNVSKYSVKPYTVQSWKVFAQKENSNKSFEQIIVFLEDSIETLQVDHNIAYKIRPINNYEQLNFTYQIPQDKKAKVVEMSLNIICDFQVIQILQPQFYQYQMQLQNYIKLTNISQYNLKFSVQFSTSIMPWQYNLPLTLNIPPICQKLKQIQSNFQGLTLLDIITYCAKSDDSPYQYKVGYFLTEKEQIDYQNGDSKFILGLSVYQQSPRLSIVLPSSFMNNSIYIMVSVMDQGGSITQLYTQTEVDHHFNCSQQNISESSELQLNVLIASMFQAIGSAESNCDSLKYDLTNYEINFQMKAIKVYKNYSKTQQTQLRLLAETAFESCLDSKTSNYNISYSPNNGSAENKNQLLKQLHQDIQEFQKIVSILSNLNIQIIQKLQDQAIEWDQSIFEQQEQVQQSLIICLLMADNLLSKLAMFKEIDEQKYQIFLNLLLLIDQITQQIQDNALINGIPIVEQGELILWKLQRQTRQKFNEILGLESSLDDEVVMFVQKESIELNLNPFIFSNSTLQKMKEILNSTNLIIYPQKLISTKLKNFRQNGIFVRQQQISEKLTYQMQVISNCSDESFQAQTNNFSYSIHCFVILENELFEQCELEVKQLNQYQKLQNSKSNINCICSSLGQIIIVYQQLENANISINQTAQLNKILNSFDYQKVDIKSPIFIVLLIYICLVSVIYMYFLFSKPQIIEIEEVNLKEHIKIFPGNFIIMKQNFKYMHQLSQFFYFQDSNIQRSFYFIDINVQFCIMFLILGIINLQPNYIEFIVVAQIGMIFRIVSRIEQGFYRLNIVFRILIEFFNGLLFLGAGIAMIVLTANQTTERKIQKIFQFFLGITMYEIMNEPILIIACVFCYKLTFESIQNKEFNVLFHFFYYFAYHERLEEIFKQYIII